MEEQEEVGRWLGVAGRKVVVGLRNRSGMRRGKVNRYGWLDSRL